MKVPADTKYLIEQEILDLLLEEHCWTSEPSQNEQFWELLHKAQTVASRVIDLIETLGV